MTTVIELQPPMRFPRCDGATTDLAGRYGAHGPRCLYQSRYQIDGKFYCKIHAQIEALAILRNQSLSQHDKVFDRAAALLEDDHD
jgi:hypothetical protein